MGLKVPCVSSYQFIGSVFLHVQQGQVRHFSSGSPGLMCIALNEKLSNRSLYGHVSHLLAIAAVPGVETYG